MAFFCTEHIDAEWYTSDIHITTNDTEAFISLSNQGLYHNRTQGLENLRKCFFFAKLEMF